MTKLIKFRIISILTVFQGFLIKVTSKTNNKGISFIFILLFIALVLGVALYFVWKNVSTAPALTGPVSSQPPASTQSGSVSSTQKPQQATPKATPLPSPIPLKPDSGTKGTYQIGMGAHTGPSITQAIFDPLDVQKGQQLTVTISADYPAGISKLTATLTEDNSSQNIPVQLTSGTNTLGKWTGSITLTDSVQYKYILTITATSTDGKTSTVSVAPRS